MLDLAPFSTLSYTIYSFPQSRFGIYVAGHAAPRQLRLVHHIDLGGVACCICTGEKQCKTASRVFRDLCVCTHAQGGVCLRFVSR